MTGSAEKMSVEVAGHGHQPSDLVMDVPPAPAPVDGRELSGQHRSQRSLAVVLRDPPGGPGSQLRHSLDQQPPTQVSQPVVDVLHRFLRVDMGSLLGDDIPGVQFPGHIHNGHTRFLFPTNHRPVDGGSPPVFGQQRGMDIDAAHWRQSQDIVR